MKLLKKKRKNKGENKGKTKRKTKGKHRKSPACQCYAAVGMPQFRVVLREFGAPPSMRESWGSLSIGLRWRNMQKKKLQTGTENVRSSVPFRSVPGFLETLPFRSVPFHRL